MTTAPAPTASPNTILFNSIIDMHSPDQGAAELIAPLKEASSYFSIETAILALQIGAMSANMAGSGNLTDEQVARQEAGFRQTRGGAHEVRMGQRLLDRARAYVKDATEKNFMGVLSASRIIIAATDTSQIGVEPFIEWVSAVNLVCSIMQIHEHKLTASEVRDVAGVIGGDIGAMEDMGTVTLADVVNQVCAELEALIQ